MLKKQKESVLEEFEKLQDDPKFNQEKNYKKNMVQVI